MKWVGTEGFPPPIFEGPGGIPTLFCRKMGGKPFFDTQLLGVNEDIKGYYCEIFPPELGLYQVLFTKLSTRRSGTIRSGNVPGHTMCIK